MKRVMMLSAVAGAMLLCVAAHVTAAEFRKGEDCVVGAKVADRQDKTGTVTGVKTTMCEVQLDDGTKRSYLFWMLRPAGSSKVTTDKLVNGVYPCYSSAGSSINYAFMDIHIEGPDTYRDKKGNKGKYRLDTATGKIVFESGPLKPANAKLLSGPKIGLNMDGGNHFNMSCGLKK